MIIARAPLRVSFGGGGTDLAAYYQEFGGLVLSVSIDKYIYAMVSQSSSTSELVSADLGTLVRGAVDEGQSAGGGLRLARLVIEQCAPGQHLRVFLTGEVPSGTGLGSSSAMTVALITALDELAGTQRDPMHMAELASQLEIDYLGSPVGKQDHYASALGGLNTLTFAPDGTVLAEPFLLATITRQTLERRMMLFYTGVRRDAGSILAHQQRQSADHNPQTLDALHAIKALALDMRTALAQGDLDGFGLLLHRAWEQKRRVTAGISNAFIDHCVQLAREAGALGAKITGAGGGGFLLVYCTEDRQNAVAAALATLGLSSLPFRFTAQGARVVLNDPGLELGSWPH